MLFGYASPGGQARTPQQAWADLEAQKAALPSAPRRKGKPSAEEQKEDAARVEALRGYREARRAFLASSRFVSERVQPQPSLLPERLCARSAQPVSGRVGIELGVVQVARHPNHVPRAAGRA